MYLDLTWVIVAGLLAVLVNHIYKIALGVRAYRARKKRRA